MLYRLLKSVKNWVSKNMDVSWVDKEAEMYFGKENNDSNKG